jgi:hypothetical protein
VKVFNELTTVVHACMKENPERAKAIAGEVFLPAMALIEINNPIADHVWAILS